MIGHHRLPRKLEGGRRRSHAVIVSIPGAYSSTVRRWHDISGGLCFVGGVQYLAIRDAEQNTISLMP